MRKHPELRDALLVLFICAAFLIPASWTLFASRLHFTGLGNSLNDQISYIGVARNLVRLGKLTQSLVYPSLLSGTHFKEMLYLPGHYLCLALSFFLFGSNDFTAMLPNILAYIATALFVFFTGLKLYGRSAAFWGVLLFCAFPPTLVYSFTAMAEITLLAASMFAIVAVAATPQKQRLWVAPFAMALPALFRETTVLLILPLAALCAGERPGRFRRAFFCAAGCILAVIVVYFIAAPERARFLISHPFGKGFNLPTFVNSHGVVEMNYNDAFRPPDIPRSQSLLDKFPLRANFRNFLAGLRHPSDHEQVWVLILALSSLLLLARSLIRKELTSFSAAAGVVGLGITTAIFLFYGIGLGGVRLTLMAWPLIAVAAGAALQSVYQRLHQKNSNGALLARVIFCVLVAGGCFFSIRRTAPRIPVGDDWNQMDLTFLESLHHDDRSTLVAPLEVSTEYIYHHYPVKWSFVPYNRKTLALLNELHPIGTLLLNPSDHDHALTREDAEAVGLRFEKIAEDRGRKFQVFRGENSK